MVYDLQKTRTWNKDHYKKMLTDINGSINTVIQESANSIMIRNFNCYEVSWKHKSTEGSKISLKNKLLKIMINNIMTQ